MAKSRLADAFSAQVREQLVLAMLADTLSACAGCDAVAAVTVIGSDSAVTKVAAAAGADVVADDTLWTSTVPHPPRRRDGRWGRPGEPDRLNQVVAAAARLVQAPTVGVAVVHADLPALSPDELARALSAAAPGRRSFVADRSGNGTTALLAPAGVPLAPQFGPQSALRHRDGGAVAITAAVPGLRCDVDSRADLDEALRIGLGVSTARVVAAITAATSVFTS